MDVATRKGHTKAVAALDAALLFSSARSGDLDTLHERLRDGADAAARDGSERTALHFAASEGGADATAALLAAGGGPNLRDSHGAFPVHLAGSALQAEAIAALFAGGTDPEARYRGGYGPTAMELTRFLGGGY